MKRIWIIVLTVLLAFTAIAAASRQSPRAAYVLICANAAEGVLKTENGSTVQALTFDHMGQTAAGPLPPGDYTVEAGPWTASFTLRTNAAVSRVTGDGWSDGESLRLGAVTTGQLTVFYEGDWRWTLEGEGAGEAVPDLSRQDGGMVCRFSELPLGYYVLRGPERDIPILLTAEEPQQTLTLQPEPKNDEPYG